MWRISPEGGSPERIIAIADDEEAQRPSMLPDGRTVLFTVAKRTGDERWDKAQIVAQSIGDSTRKVLIDGGVDARYLATGYLTYVVGGTMLAVPFDIRSLALKGSPTQVVLGIRRSVGDASVTAHVAVSNTGTLVYRPGPPTISSNTRSLVLGGDGRDPVPLKIPPAFYLHPRVSPDGKMLAVAQSNQKVTDVWVYDLSQVTQIRRLTFDGSSSFPIWSSDSRRVAFQSARDGDKAIWWQHADGRQPERLTKPGSGEEHIPETWSVDGKHLLLSVVKEGKYALGTYMPDTGELQRVGNIESGEPLSATFSPDGKWIAYAYTERGESLSPDRGIFIEPFPPTGEKHQAPKTALDYHPVWARDGKSLFYFPGANRPVVAVPIVTRPSIAFGAPAQSDHPAQPGLFSYEARGYDLLPDGRYLSVSTSTTETITGASNELRVVINWHEELKRIAPMK